jgi:hypothetical protein
VIIDRQNLQEASTRISQEVSEPIRFAFDTVGADTAAWCQSVLASRITANHLQSSQPGIGNATTSSKALSHLVCLVGAPKETNSNVRIHTVPIKLFHTNHQIGQAISSWLSSLLQSSELKLPQTVFEHGGLDAIGSSLDRIRSGELSGKRLVVTMKTGL